MTRLLALASGKGTNFRALLDAVSDARISPAEFVGLVVDRHGTGAEEMAHNAGVQCRVVNFKEFTDRRAYDNAFATAVDDFEADLILAAGYMRLLDATFVHQYKNRIMNIHPSLLPAFPGLHAQRQALEYGVKVSGCTVHFVDEGLDSGPIVVQKAVMVPDDADEAELSEKIREAEHESYIEAVALFCAGRLHFEGRRVTVIS